MKVPLSWLSQFVPITLDTPQLCERLTMGGLEVDGVEEIGADMSGVVVGEIVSTTPHPRADRLTVCEVRSGPGPAVSVVCGATNMKAGDRVAYAPPGTDLPGGRRIEQVEIRGVSSAGMLCSEAELGLSGEASGILIAAPDAPLGERVGAYLGIEDTVIEFSITPNRGDCLSVLGIAREIAALTGVRMWRTRINLRERGAPAGEAIAVRIEDPGGCARYAARLVRGVQVEASPAWVDRRLRAVGMRPINNVVDVTNLVMMERGQPLHAFDYDRLPGKQIVVRRAGASETIQTLDGVVRNLVAEDLLITTGEIPIAIAGVMGGAETEVAAGTGTVLLEAAWFDPGTIRRTARRLDLHSESAYRFERGVDVSGVLAALDRAAVLLKQLAGGEIARGVVDAYPGERQAEAILLRPRRVEDLLGFSLSRSEISSTLKLLGASFSGGPGGAMVVVFPTFRSDLKREIDVIEEVARLVGYERIPATMPAVHMDGGSLPKRLYWEREIKRVLIAYGLSETISLSFASPRVNELFKGVGVHGVPVELLNPVSREESELRCSLLGGLVTTWRHNRNQGATRIAGFSVGKVYWRSHNSLEGWRLAGILAGDLPRAGLGSPLPVGFADAKGLVEALLERLRLADQVCWERWGDAGTFHPGKSAIIRCGGEVIGMLGALHPDVELELEVEGAHWLFELDMEKLVPYSPSERVFAGLPRYPAVARDLAVVADAEFASDRVVQFVKHWRRELVEDVALFDEYIGAPIPSGKKGLAYSISYRASDRTLTDEEVNALQDELTTALRRELQVELRQ